jgi:dTDP-4-dehydrorhamnose reductase
MTILVFGRNGQVAKELQAMTEVTALGHAEVDLMIPGAAKTAIVDHAPSVVINAAAYTAVDKAEQDDKSAFRLNAEAPGEMARACAKLDVPFVHISTDYVFAGSGSQPWLPDDATGPIGVYGRSKLAGEDAVRDAGGRYAILRTSWVFSAHGANFVKTMLQLSQTRDTLNVVDDQIGGPTPAYAIAAACLKIADQLIRAPNKSGTYHFSGAPDVNWHGFAQEIFTRAGRKTAVSPIPTSAYPTPAARPLNSRLDCSSTEDVFGLLRPDWRTALDHILKELEITK